MVQKMDKHDMDDVFKCSMNDKHTVEAGDSDFEDNLDEKFSSEIWRNTSMLIALCMMKNLMKKLQYVFGKIPYY